MAYQRSDRGLFVATVGWQTERECQHAGRIFSVQLSLKRLTTQEHKASDARFYSTVEHWLIFFCENRKAMQCWSWKCILFYAHLWDQWRIDSRSFSSPWLSVMCVFKIAFWLRDCRVIIVNKRERAVEAPVQAKAITWPPASFALVQIDQVVQVSHQSRKYNEIHLYTLLCF